MQDPETVGAARSNTDSVSCKAETQGAETSRKTDSQRLGEPTGQGKWLAREFLLLRGSFVFFLGFELI